MTIKLAERINQVQSSATLALNSKATALKLAGTEIFNLSVGELDFDMPEHVKQAGIRAIQNNLNKYTPVDGTTELKKAIQQKFLRENNLNYDLSQIIVSTGAKQSLFNICQVLLNPGDEAIIPAPCWVSYPEMVKNTHAQPVFIHTTIEHRYKITAKQLQNSITDKTRLIFLNTPSNPTGVLYSADELNELADVLLEHPKIFIISDDIYEHILWNGIFNNILNVCPKLYDRTLVVNGLSKSHAMTGWRIGYAAGPVEIIAATKKLQSHSTSGPCSIAQAAATVALNGDQQFLKTFIDILKKRHDFILNIFRQMPYIKCIPADGAFYSFINVQEFLDHHNTIKTDMALAEYLLNDAHVALTPGTAFNAPGHLRLSFAASLETLEKAVERIKRAIL
ncbi:MAG: aspartate aminotransferase [Gammaproteobacteria bacterium RIFCSPLOWO2_02_FULL_42_9]|nr:MAG: aspartate aminotransferase [Gammaproteobacteria bacterium RIFCSPLOWO2_02_FULL_42_9]